MRNISYLIVHCSDSDRASHDNIETIRKWHVNDSGWSDIGYHYVITKGKGLCIGRPISRPGAHVRGHNNYSVGICLTGRYVFTPEQFDLLELLCQNLIDIFGLTYEDIFAHYELDDKKECPNFDIELIRERFYTLN